METLSWILLWVCFLFIRFSLTFKAFAGIKYKHMCQCKQWAGNTATFYCSNLTEQQLLYGGNFTRTEK